MKITAILTLIALAVTDCRVYVLHQDRISSLTDFMAIALPTLCINCIGILPMLLWYKQCKDSVNNN